MLYPYPLGMKNAYFKNSMDAKSLIKKLSNCLAVGFKKIAYKKMGVLFFVSNKNKIYFLDFKKEP